MGDPDEPKSAGECGCANGLVYSWVPPSPPGRPLLFCKGFCGVFGMVQCIQGHEISIDYKLNSVCHRLRL